MKIIYDPTKATLKTTKNEQLQLILTIESHYPKKKDHNGWPKYKKESIILIWNQMLLVDVQRKV